MKLRNPRVEPVPQSTFAAFTRSTDFALLKVGASHELDVDASITQYLDAEYPDRFTYGSLLRDSIPTSAWWNKYFGAILGKVQTPLFDVKTGFYLFHAGKLITWHSGQADISEPGAIASLTVNFTLLAVALATESPGLGKAVVDVEAKKGADALLAHLETVIAQVGLSDGATKRVQAASVAHSSDPYVVLGIAPTATFEDVKRAHREGIKRNHPDKVNEMSPEIQQLAEHRTKEIQLAFEAIKKSRNRT